MNNLFHMKKRGHLQPPSRPPGTRSASPRPRQTEHPCAGRRGCPRGGTPTSCCSRPSLRAEALSDAKWILRTLAVWLRRTAVSPLPASSSPAPRSCLFPCVRQALSPKPPLALSPGFWASIISSDGGSCDPKYRQGTGTQSRSGTTWPVLSSSLFRLLPTWGLGAQSGHGLEERW